MISGIRALGTRRAALVSLVALVVAVLAGALLYGSRHGPAGFPRGGGRSMSGMEARTGDRVVFGANVLHNSGDRPVELTGARLEGDVPADAAEVVEVRAMDPRLTQGSLVGAGPWPYERYEQLSRPLAGYRLEPGADAEILYVVRVARPGAWEWPTATVTYSSGWWHYEATTENGFMTCRPRARDCRPSDH